MISPPRIWLVPGDKLGDNAQLKMITGSLGLPDELDRIRQRVLDLLAVPWPPDYPPGREPLAIIVW